MLLSDRHRGLIHFCLTAMEVTWITPFVALFFHQQSFGWSPALILARLCAVLLGWLLVLELLNRLGLDSPGYELTVSALIVLSSLLLVRFWLYGSAPAWDFGWLRNAFNAVFNAHQGLRPELVLIVTSVVLWQRAASATSRSLDFFSVGVSFRLGVLVLILGAGLFSYCSGKDVTYLLWLYLALGLTAVGLARTYEKAAGAPSAGTLLPLPRLAQMLIAVGVTVGGAAGLSALYTPARIKTALAWLQPLWKALGLLLLPLERIVQLLLQIVFVSLDWVLQRLVVSFNWEVLGPFVEKLSEWLATPRGGTGAGITLPPWVWTGLRYAGVLLAILLALGFVLLYLNKIRASSTRHGTEEEINEEITFGGATMDRRARWLRDKIGLVRRYGLSRRLLAAVSVQNMYANLCRLARQRGYPRHPALPPDAYLPVLARAFAGQEEPLARITAAYMRVHYGDQAVSRSEVRRLRRDYDQARAAEVEVHP